MSAVVDLEIVAKEGAALGEDGRGFGTGEVAHRVGDVDGMVHQCAAAGLDGIGDPGGVSGGEGRNTAVAAEHAVDGADLPLLDELLGALDHREETEDEGDVELNPGFVAGGDHRAGIGEGGGDRFLAEDVLAGFRGGGHELGVGVGGAADDDGLDVVAVEDGVEIGVGLGHVEASRHRPAPVDVFVVDRGEDDVVEAVERM